MSYTAADQAWAEWIAWQLEGAGYRVLIQAWDFVPGSNWQIRMEQGARHAQRTIAVLSTAYLSSVYGKTEWQEAQRADPHGFERKLLPVRIEACERPGLLGAIVSIDLFDHDTDQAARHWLLHSIGHALTGRAKPTAPPDFPALDQAGERQGASELTADTPAPQPKPVAIRDAHVWLTLFRNAAHLKEDDITLVRRKVIETLHVQADSVSLLIPPSSQGTPSVKVMQYVNQVAIPNIFFALRQDETTRQVAINVERLAATVDRLVDTLQAEIREIKKIGEDAEDPPIPYPQPTLPSPVPAPGSRPRSPRLPGGSPTPPPRGEVGPLRFKDPRGEMKEWKVQFGPDRSGSPSGGAGDLDVSRLVQPVDDTNVYVQKRIPADRLSLETCGPLFNEIQIGLHLSRTLTDSYPRELSEVIGYDDECDEPFVLLRERGRSAEQATGRLTDHNVQFQISLLRGLSYLDAADVVHRAITPSRIRWDGRTVQITNFRYARFFGEPSPSAPEPDWAAPEARNGHYYPDPAEDLWSAGLVLVHVFDCAQAPGTSASPDSRQLRAGLDRTLDGVFRDLPNDRPSVGIMMGKLGYGHAFFRPEQLVRPEDVDAKFAEGIEQFDVIRARKRRHDRGSST